jgi:hypothetical protein
MSINTPTVSDQPAAKIFGAPFRQIEVKNSAATEVSAAPLEPLIKTPAIRKLTMTQLNFVEFDRTNRSAIEKEQIIPKVVLVLPKPIDWTNAPSPGFRVRKPINTLIREPVKNPPKRMSSEFLEYA